MFSDIKKDYYFIEQNLNQKQVQCSNGPLINKSNKWEVKKCAN